jgi:hypothetical protein
MFSSSAQLRFQADWPVDIISSFHSFVLACQLPRYRTYRYKYRYKFGQVNGTRHSR